MSVRFKRKSRLKGICNLHLHEILNWKKGQVCPVHGCATHELHYAPPMTPERAKEIRRRYKNTNAAQEFDEVMV